MTFATIVGNIENLVNQSVLPLLFALGFVFFLINIVRYFFIEGGEEGQTKGRKAVLYGLIGLVVLFAVWGIINLLLATLNSAVGAPTT
jgi:succinate dehydrogenase/fumarate reductase cytochrome b subunit